MSCQIWIRRGLGPEDVDHDHDHDHEGTPITKLNQNAKFASPDCYDWTAHLKEDEQLSDHAEHDSDGRRRAEGHCLQNRPVTNFVVGKQQNSHEVQSVWQNRRTEQQ